MDDNFYDNLNETDTATKVIEMFVMPMDGMAALTKNLSDEQLGRIFRALISYKVTLDIPSYIEDPLEKALVETLTILMSR